MLGSPYIHDEGILGDGRYTVLLNTTKRLYRGVVRRVMLVIKKSS